MNYIDTENFVWSMKYRPQSIKDCILPKETKRLFENILKAGEFQSLLLSGPPGVGKTVSAISLCKDLKLDYMMINASEENGIDVLRQKIKQFASTVSMGDESRHKAVILDEAEYLPSQSTQPALRNFIETFSKNCRFILTANFKNRIIGPLQSRCTNIDFNIADFKTPDMLKQILGRIEFILKNENVVYEKAVLAEIVFKWAPDLRRTINELQKYCTQSATGSIDSGILIHAAIDLEIRGLIKHLKEKDFRMMRQWLVDHSDIDTNIIYRKLYDSAKDFIKPESIPNLILILAEYQYRSAFVVDQEINNAAALTEIMMKIHFI